MKICLGSVFIWTCKYYYSSLKTQSKIEKKENKAKEIQVAQELMWAAWSRTIFNTASIQVASMLNVLGPHVTRQSYFQFSFVGSLP